MKITEVKVNLTKPINGVIGYANIIFNNCLILHSIAIHEKLNKPNEYRLTYPTKLLANRARTLFHPLTPELSESIENAVFNELKDVLEDDRHNNSAT